MALHRPSSQTATLCVMACVTVAALATTVFAADFLSITLKHNSPRELQTKAELEQVLRDYDLRKFTFTREVVIEEQAINHAFPILTLNTRFADSEDELLSSFIHEQLHWYLREHPAQMRDAVDQLRQFYPKVPVGGSEGAETEYSTYGHIVDCYLEIQADRQLIGEERTRAVIRDKKHYSWIYQTDLNDEPRIAAIVHRERLQIE